MNRIEPLAETKPNAIEPLPGEAGIPNVAAAPRPPYSLKAIATVVVMVISLIAFTALAFDRYFSAFRKHGEPNDRAADRPAVATGEPKRLDLSVPPPAAPTSAPVPRIPAIVPIASDADPIGIRRNEATQNTSPKAPPPEDAPALLVSGGPTAPARQEPTTESGPLAQTRRNLEGYERKLQAVLDGQSAPNRIRDTAPTSAPVPTTPGLFGGQLQASITPRVGAALLGDRSLVLPKGTVFTCALKTRVVSATSGLVGCQVQRNVFSDDGRVLLVERGSHLDGEYRVTSFKPGTVRIPVLWTRIRTPLGVTVDLDSPGTGPLGESGIDGYVDNRWLERIGAALLLSLIDDSVQLALQRESSGGTGSAIILPSTTANGSKLADKVLESTINIPPLIYQNQGGIAGVYVARDIDFSSVYELKPVPR